MFFGTLLFFLIHSTFSGASENSPLATTANQDLDPAVLSCLEALSDATELPRIITLREGRRIVAGSGKIRSALSQAIEAAKTDATVLILGPTGTGKDSVATLIYEHSLRNQNLFVRVDCSALPIGLLESELFGHAKGAFTTAHVERKGLFAIADGGTVFLDEVAELPLDAQAKLLALLQDGTFRQIGSNKAEKTNVRVIAATNKNLAALVEAGKFREDLYYRLNAVTIHLPPLNSRIDDFPDLVEVLTEDLIRTKKLPPKKIQPQVVAFLQKRQWPGNIRDLENTIQTLLIFSKNDPITEAEARRILTNQNPSETLRTLSDARRHYLDWVLRESASISSAAAALRISESRLNELMDQSKTGNFWNFGAFGIRPLDEFEAHYVYLVWKKLDRNTERTADVLEVSQVFLGGILRTFRVQPSVSARPAQRTPVFREFPSPFRRADNLWTYLGEKSPLPVTALRGLQAEYLQKLLMDANGDYQTVIRQARISPEILAQKVAAHGLTHEAPFTTPLWEGPTDLTLKDFTLQLVVYFFEECFQDIHCTARNLQINPYQTAFMVREALGSLALSSTIPLTNLYSINQMLIGSPLLEGICPSPPTWADGRVLSLGEIRQLYIQTVLKKQGGNRQKTADHLWISTKTLQTYLRHAGPDSLVTWTGPTDLSLEDVVVAHVRSTLATAKTVTETGRRLMINNKTVRRYLEKVSHLIFPTEPPPGVTIVRALTGLLSPPLPLEQNEPAVGSPAQ